MQGLGYWIWRVETIRKTHSPEQLARLLAGTGARWVTWKISEAMYPYNQVGGNDKLLIEYMQALEGVGIRSGGWSYVYPEKTGAQAGVIAERIAKFGNNLEHGFDHVLLDVEKEWKKPNLGGAIDTLLYIDVGAKFPIGFCSYRYPELHHPLNFSRFLKNPTVNINAPQVYWLGARNPAEQLDRSYDQYAKLTDKPFVPIGGTFNWGEWEPTIPELTDFVAHCMARKWYTYGFYSLDWILTNRRIDILEAIGGVTIEPPVEPPPPQPEPEEGLLFQVISDTLNVRNGPGKQYPVVDKLIKGEYVQASNVGGEDSWVEIAPGQWCCNRTSGTTYLKKV